MLTRLVDLEIVRYTVSSFLQLTDLPFYSVIILRELWQAMSFPSRSDFLSGDLK